MHFVNVRGFNQKSNREQSEGAVDRIDLQVSEAALGDRVLLVVSRPEEVTREEHVVLEDGVRVLASAPLQRDLFIIYNLDSSPEKARHTHITRRGSDYLRGS